MSSPVGSDVSNEDKPRMIMSYMNHPSLPPGKSGILKFYDRELSYLILDHTYAKPWNSHPFAARTKPALKLFYQFPSRPHLHPEGLTSWDHLIDTSSTVDERSAPPYDTIKARAMMTECERHVTLSKVEEGTEDWEEQVVRVGWTFAENRLFNRATRILHSDRLARLSIEGSPNEPALCRIHVDKSAKRFRQMLSTANWDSKLTQWLHVTILDNVNSKYLPAYLDILQSLKAKVPTLVEKMIANANPSAPRSALAGAETAAFITKRPWDPVLPSLAHHKLKKLPFAPILLVAPSGPAPSSANQTRRMRFWHSQLANLGKVVPVTMHAAGGGRSVIIGQCLEHMIGATRTKAAELKSLYPNRPIVMLGWGVGAAIAMQVALHEKAAAVVCLGLPLAGLKGTRGDVDDPLLESRTTTLFVLGQNATNCSIDDAEGVRERMKADTSLVIVGGADEWLRVSHFKKKSEGVTQTIVDRCILDEISDFLGSTLANMSHSLDNSYGMTQRQYWVPPPPQPPAVVSVPSDKKRNSRATKRKAADNTRSTLSDDLAPLDSFANLSSKWPPASGSQKKEFRLMAHSPTATIMRNPTNTPPPPSYPTPGGGHQTLNQLLDAVPADLSLPLKRAYGVNRATTGGRNPFNKRVRLLQGMMENTSATTHSPPPSGLGNTNPANLWRHLATDDLAPSTPPLPTLQPPNPVVTAHRSPLQTTVAPTGNITLSIGQLASVGSLTPVKQHASTGGGSAQLTPMTSLVRSAASKPGDATSMPAMTMLPGTTRSTMTVSTTTTPSTFTSGGFQPIRSAFSTPAPRPAAGFGSVVRHSYGQPMTFTMSSRPTSTPTQSVGTTAATTSTTSTSLLYQHGGRLPGPVLSTTHEPNLEQVQAIQRLQFHDFPLTTASLTKTPTGSPVITQAKILSNRAFDIRRLQQVMSQASTSVTHTTSTGTIPGSGTGTITGNVFGKSTVVSNRDMSALCRLAVSQSGADKVGEGVGGSTGEPGPSTSKTLNFTVSSIKLHIPDRKTAAVGVGADVADPSMARRDGGTTGSGNGSTPTKSPQVSVIMLTSDKSGKSSGGARLGGEGNEALSYKVISGDDFAKQSSTLQRILESALGSQQQQVQAAARGRQQQQQPFHHVTLQSSQPTTTATLTRRVGPAKPAATTADIVPDIRFHRLVPPATNQPPTGQSVDASPPPVTTTAIDTLVAEVSVGAGVKLDEHVAEAIGEQMEMIQVTQEVEDDESVSAGGSEAANCESSITQTNAGSPVAQVESGADCEAEKVDGGESSTGEQAVSPRGGSSRFKPPAFPTIAATRTRRIRPPKYMYYDL